MNPLDWGVLAAALAAMVGYGVWRGRGQRSGEGFLTGREMRWTTVGLSIMATQASAITFLSTPGQAYADGMRFAQFYLGLPLAMIAISIWAVPVFHRLRVHTAYEMLETRFDLKTRTLTALLFLLQRGLAAGLTIFAPSLIVSVILGWDIRPTIAVIGILVVIYTTSGGTRAVTHTQMLQAGIILAGMATAFAVLWARLPDGVGLADAWHVAGAAGRMNAIVVSGDINDRYTLFSGLIGGAFLALAYFGTDQSQVQRMLTGRSVAHSRLGLLLNGMLKVPMQLAILLLGVTVFAFYQLNPEPVFHNPVEVSRARSGQHGESFRAAETRFEAAAAARAAAASTLVAARRAGDAAAVSVAEAAYREARAAAEQTRQDALRWLGGTTAPNDTNYVFLSFVVSQLPAGVVGLVLAAVFAAAMSASAAELNALAATTEVDIVQRLLHSDGGDARTVRTTRVVTVAWGAFAIGFAELAGGMGSLVEAVNMLGSLFYGTLLGIFVVAFFVRRVGGTAVFVAALLAEAVVLACAAWCEISFLWYNLIGCLVVVAAAWAVQAAIGRRQPGRTA
ncbi:MAG TPA: sodium:solute symporter [Thermoanaerobaculaceae bacterium]|mgnify:CR=1 FL=1|nr:sodium:solute symporter [Thermoanaerobaculaceae bacterium]HRS17007.1 sodium:solute symporter [Thermoanaerobaculaceae bacterium]